MSVLPEHLRTRVSRALDIAAKALLDARSGNGIWVGELSSSALSTATATCALAIVDRQRFAKQIDSGLQWLADNLNADGGWGDTIKSISNLSTTTLCWAAFGAASSNGFEETLHRAEKWIGQHTGGLTGEKLAPAIIACYGKDRTFSVPILTMCALTGRLGHGSEAWKHVIPLPFELAACPHELFAALRLPVVSYALPALIAMGIARHVHLPSANPIARLIRSATRGKTLRVLDSIRPSSGGFLEATPLTSFVTMSLAGSGFREHPVVTRGVEFLERSQRNDGSWPIDTNLSTWVTTLAVNALGQGPALVAPSPQSSPPKGRGRYQWREWLLGQQYLTQHSYTHAAPGGWAWTDLPGGVPDADDTAGAVLALRQPAPEDPAAQEAAFAGIKWLLGLQNTDGGIPTFCRGWGALPFDHSSPDITAHALRAWRGELPTTALGERVARATRKAWRFLGSVQREDGSWIPLWFGNQFAPNEENPTYGTSRVVLALAECADRRSAAVSAAGCGGVSPPARISGETPDKPAGEDACATHLRRGIEWLVKAQARDGSWGGAPGVPSSIEETALALEALGKVKGAGIEAPGLESAIVRGSEWLVQKVESGEWTNPSPIGFYFAKLWYYEKLYPLIFTVAALRDVAALDKS